MIGSLVNKIFPICLLLSVWQQQYKSYCQTHSPVGVLYQLQTQHANAHDQCVEFVHIHLIQLQNLLSGPNLHFADPICSGLSFFMSSCTVFTIVSVSHSAEFSKISLFLLVRFTSGIQNFGKGCTVSLYYFVNINYSVCS